MIFQLSWSWYEAVEYWLFEHPTKTEAEWQEDCKRAIKEAGPKYLDNEKSWCSALDWLSAATKKLEEYGYKPVTPVSFGHFGSYIIEHEQKLGEDDLKFQEIVGKDLMDKAIQKNKELNCRLYKELTVGGKSEES